MLMDHAYKTLRVGFDAVELLATAFGRVFGRHGRSSIHYKRAAIR